MVAQIIGFSFNKLPKAGLYNNLIAKLSHKPSTIINIREANIKAAIRDFVIFFNIIDFFKFQDVFIFKNELLFDILNYSKMN